MPPSLDTPDEIATVIVAVIVALGTITGGIVAAVALGVAWWRSHIGPLIRGAADDLAVARAQVSPNHGSSMSDALGRVETAVQGLTIDLRELRSDAREDRKASDRAHSEIFHRLRSLESPPERETR